MYLCLVLTNTGLDIRLPPTVDLNSFMQQLDTWVAEEGVSREFVVHSMVNPVTPHQAPAKWWEILEAALHRVGTPIRTQIFPASTDARFLRRAGVPAFGFSPMNNTPILLHDHNEFLNKDVFLRGIDVYCTIIKDLENTERLDTE